MKIIPFNFCRYYIMILKKQKLLQHIISLNFKQNKYAFVTYKMEKDSEIAKNEMHQTILAGLPIIVEWSKKSARFLENEIKPRLFK